MKTGRPSDRLIVIEYIGGVDYAEVLFNIIKHYIDAPERDCADKKAASDRAGDLYSNGLGR